MGRSLFCVSFWFYKKNCLIIKWKIMPAYLLEAFSPTLQALSPQSPTPALPNPGGMSAIYVQTRWETNFPRNRPLPYNLNIRLVQWPAVQFSSMQCSRYVVWIVIFVFDYLCLTVQNSNPNIKSNRYEIYGDMHPTELEKGVYRVYQESSWTTKYANSFVTWLE